MLVQCPSCHTTYRVSDSLITAPNPTFRCSRCKHIFVLGLRAETSPLGAATAISPAPPLKEEEPELSFSFAPAEKMEMTEERGERAPDFEAREQPPAPESTAQAEAEPLKAPIHESLPVREEIPVPDPVVEEPFPTPGIEQPPLLAQEREDSWSIAPNQPQGEEPFTIPEEKPSMRMEAPANPAPDFEDEWQAAFPPMEERETGSALDPYRDRPLSVVPYISLFGTLLLLYSLLTLMHQTQPQSIETVLKAIPWVGPTVLKNNHLRQGITFQSLRPTFQTIQGNREVFVLSGVAVNRNPVSVREVRVEGHIFNAEGREIDRQVISVGNAISSKIIKDLTAQEISILQKLNPQKRFEIPPDESAGFVIVFLKPSAEVKNFSCRIASVEAGA